MQTSPFNHIGGNLTIAERTDGWMEEAREGAKIEASEKRDNKTQKTLSQLKVRQQQQHQEPDH